MTSHFHDWNSQSLGAILLDWLRSFWPAATPDPWTAEVDQAIRGPDALPVCHRCFTPQDGEEWFCTECGTAVGPYNNMMPYLQVFSMGEVLRSGVGPAARFTKLTVPGYVLVAVSEGFALAPLYYIRLVINWRRMSKIAGADSPGFPEDDSQPHPDADSGQS